ncbi:ribokinase [Armatimonas sp.]|uniref:ribokinase n=1 Tax=Armatimonas sp. TaxID=1872638 RepID=UPI00286AB5D7|nr:ribokinase [Armatimonas sp.]
MKRPKIVVVGSSNTDLVVSVPQIPAPGQTVLGGALQTVAGGKGANQAVAAARLGGDVCLIARVGDDAYGTVARANFEHEGLDTRFVFVTAGVASGVALIAVDQTTGENSIVVAPGANACLRAADIAAASAAFEEAKMVVVSLEIPDEAVFAAVEAGFSRGIPVLLNPAPARALPREILEKLTILTPNQTECEQLGGSEALLAGGVKTLITTLGASGVHLEQLGKSPQRFPAPSVIPVDTVAAGDCFTGALAVELARGEPLDRAIGFACAAAAVKVTRPGAQSGLPYRGQVTVQ